jgi:hypothetical protein
LSHNYLQTFPARFSECTSLRYLNVRQNRIKEFPLAVSMHWLRGVELKDADSATPSFVISNRSRFSI